MKRNGKGKLIGILCIALVFMGIGFAALQTNLNISGTAKASGTFDIKITDVSPSDSSSFTDYTATINPVFEKPGDSVTYEIEVTNNGTIDALIKAILDDSNNQKDSHGNDIFLFEIKYEDDTSIVDNPLYELEAGADTIVTVTVTYNSETDERPNGDVSFRIDLETMQLASDKAKEEILEQNESNWNFKTLNGVLTAYNPDTTINNNGYIVVDATDLNGNPITEINSNSFSYNTNVSIIQSRYSSSSSDFQIYIDYPRNSNEFNSIKTALSTNYGIDEDTTPSVVNSSLNNFHINDLFNNNSTSLRKIDNQIIKMYAKGEIFLESDPNVVEAVQIDISTGQLTEGVDFNAFMIQESENSIPKIYIDYLKGSNEYNIIKSALEAFGIIENTNSLPVFNKRKLTPKKMYNIKNDIIIKKLEDEDDEESEPIVANFYGKGEMTKPKFSIFSVMVNYYIDMTTGTISSTGAYNVKKLDLSRATNLRKIAKNAFLYGQIESIIFPSSGSIVIEERAFENAHISGELVLTDAVISIGKAAFENNQISSLVLPSNITEIGEWAFNNNQIENEIIIPKNIVTINASTFSSNRIPSIRYETGSKIKKIGNAAFHGNQLQTITLPDGLEEIGEWAFGFNPLGNDLTIPDSLKVIGARAFSRNYDYYLTISNLTIQNTNGLTSIASDAFDQVRINNLTIEECNEVLCSGVFDKIDNLTIESGTLYEHAFSDAGIQSVELDSSITSLPDYAFSNNAFQEIHLGHNITRIGYRALYMSSLSDLYVDMTEAEWGNVILDGTSFDSTPTIHYGR